MGLRPAKSHEKLVPQEWWGGPPGPRGTPSSRCPANDIGTMQSAGLADGDYPITLRLGGFVTPPGGYVTVQN
jgi:hypothetical protein